MQLVARWLWLPGCLFHLISGCEEPPAAHSTPFLKTEAQTMQSPRPRLLLLLVSMVLPPRPVGLHLPYYQGHSVMQLASPSLELRLICFSLCDL
jgi:hypothetical protein